VTDRADVTRRTFYSHYRDIPALVCAVEEETLEELRPYVEHITQTTLDELEDQLKSFAPCPGAVELLNFFKERADYLPALLGEGGDPAFARRMESLVRSIAHDRVVQGIIAPGDSPIVDYYLTFAISAEVGVLVRWLTTGMREPVAIMARIMTALMFVRPGDLYGRPIDFDIPSLASQAMAFAKELDDVR
jgi:AcrR family transcriptional regulator